MKPSLITFSKIEITILLCQNLQRTEKKSTNLNNVHCALEKRFLRNGRQQSDFKFSNFLFFDVVKQSFRIAKKWRDKHAQKHPDYHVFPALSLSFMCGKKLQLVTQTPVWLVGSACSHATNYRLTVENYKPLWDLLSPLRRFCQISA